MKTYFVAAAALLAGTAALAQTAPVATAPVAPVAPARPMADQVMTRAEVVAMVRDHFGRLDTNKDGSISTAEIGDLKSKRGGGAWREHSMSETGAGRTGDPNAAFDRLDANKNGSISRDEFAKAREQRIEKRIVMRDDGTGQGKRQMRTHHMGGGMGGRMIVMADTNKDGRITLPEAETMALQHFDQMDTNHDGQVTTEERRAGRQLMRKGMQTPDAG
jgi:Ca2+-binding EF-hand superfamily protein